MTHVSVVIATRERPALLRRAIRSVLAQRFDGDLDVVVVFDGAPVDSLLDIADPRVSCIPNSRTPGLAGARNTGVQTATGPIIAFCDDDDEWLPTKLAWQLHLLESEPTASIIATGVRIRSTHGSHDRLPPVLLERRDLVASRHTEVHPSSFLFHRSLLDLVGEVDELLPGGYGEDYDLLLRASAAGPIRCVPQPLVVVHWDRTSYFAERWTQVAEGLTYLLEKFPDFRTAPRGRSRIEGQIAFAYASLSRRKDALNWAGSALRHDWRRRQAWAAMAVATGVVSGSTVMRIANGIGRGV
jgi:glycosyltransferase involved in cell wall biosynthesis